MLDFMPTIVRSFFYDVINLVIMMGYGLTLCIICITINNTNDTKCNLSLWFIEKLMYGNIDF